MPHTYEARRSNAAVIVIDMQNQFIDRNGLFPVAGSLDLAARMASFLGRMRKNGHPIIFTTFEVRPELMPSRTSLELFGDAAYKAHRGKAAELYPGLHEPGEIIVRKTRQSAFYGTDLDSVLRSLGVDTVVICGVTTNVCCLATARDAAARDYRVLFLTDLTATFDLRGINGETLPAELVQSVTCAIVSQSIGKAVSSEEAIEYLAKQ